VSEKIIGCKYFPYGNTEKTGRVTCKLVKIKNTLNQSYSKRKPYMEIE
jgi:hypothetical protein